MQWAYEHGCCCVIRLTAPHCGFTLLVCTQGEDSDDEAETDEAALASAESWEPDPIDADPSRSARSRRMHDIISMLVGIYGSKELFITEYRLVQVHTLATGSAVMA